MSTIFNEINKLQKLGYISCDNTLKTETNYEGFLSFTKKFPF